MALHHLVDESIRAHLHRTAVIEGNGSGSVDYATLGRLSNRLRDRLVSMNVRNGVRVGLYLRKSVESVASILGILKAGGAYVPVDPSAPPSRNAYVHSDSGAKLVIIERRFEATYREELIKLGRGDMPLIVLESVGGGNNLDEALSNIDRFSEAPTARDADSAAEDLAYILYTSGSTGKPKGVMLSHRNALSFIEWCSEIFQPKGDDIFSSHAPFHFDLSILDIYLSLTHGAALVLIPEEMGKDPLSISKLISDFGITIWYSVPSVLRLLAQFGKISEYDFSHLRLVLFAGEVFPVAQLRSFKNQVPRPRYFNLYGPTETNVCTFYEIPEVIEDDRVDPYPIGRICSNLTGRVVGSDGCDIAPGLEGELCISGGNVMQGYWNLPEQTINAFITENFVQERWYKTGDIVVEEFGGIYRYLGRRDRMVKKRGHRIELGEIETCLHRHPSIREASVVALLDDDAGMKIKAHLSLREGDRLSVIALKTFCSKHLPLYMIPDEFAFHDDLPKTSTGKVDLQRLNELGSAHPA
jgi:amino acid adenylation domain-containing protein